MIDRKELRSYKWSSAHYYLTGKSDKLIKPLKHPYHSSFDTYNDAYQELYAQYLKMPYEEDLNLFRNSNKSIGDGKFLSSQSLIYPLASSCEWVDQTKSLRRM